MFDRIIIVGAGRSSSELVARLTRLGPLTVVDTSLPALEASVTPASAEGELIAAQHPVVLRVADATSRLVLEDLRGDPQTAVALVSATGDDRAALELCRLGVELGYRPVVAIVNEVASAATCEKLGARPIVKSQLLRQAVEQSLMEVISGGGTGIGFGGGELVEFRVLPSSPAIGVPLTSLRADRWRVAAIYRGSALVLPTGKTTIEAEDRVLVVGDPNILQHVKETLRVGLPTFPLIHGPNVVVYLPRGRDALIEDEAEVVAERTRATGLVRMYPGAVPSRQSVLKLRARASEDEAPHKTIEDAPLEGTTLAQHIASLRAKRPGVVVSHPSSRSFGDVLFGRGGDAVTLCNEVGVPVLFPRGSVGLSRVVLGVTEGAGDLATGDVALDLARMFAVPFCLMRVRLPGYLGGADEETGQLVDTLRHRASLHGVSVELIELEGNPVREWRGGTRGDDLFVVGRRPTTRDSFASPDVALRFARVSACSVLVCTAVVP